MIRIVSGLLAALVLTFAAPAMAAPTNTGHLKAELVAKTTGAAPGSTVYLAVRQQIDKGWHTYWRNPGDSGKARGETRSQASASSSSVPAKQEASSTSANRLREVTSNRLKVRRR